MKFLILGAGNTGKAYSAYLLSKGQEVTLYDRSLERLSSLRTQNLKASGVVSGEFSPALTNCLDCAKDSDVILVCTVAEGHRPLALALKGALAPGQLLLVTNGCWGAVEFDQVLGEEADRKGCVLAETGGQLILCSSPAPEEVYLKTVKQTMTLSCVHPQQTAAVCSRLKEIFPQFVPGDSVLDTSLNNSNPMIHAPLVLFNATRLENGEDYLLFGTGVTEKVARFVEHMDAERVAVVKACGVPPRTELEMLNAFWPEKQPTLLDVLHKTPAYQVTKGPKTLNHRYLSEDLPFGLAPVLVLARRFGIDTPYMEALVHMLGLYMGVDFLTLAPDLSTVDLARYLPDAQSN